MVESIVIYNKYFMHLLKPGDITILSLSQYISMQPTHLATIYTLKLEGKMNGTKRDFYFILTEEEDIGFAVSAIKANAWKYILISTVDDTYITGP